MHRMPFVRPIVLNFKLTGTPNIASETLFIVYACAVANFDSLFIRDQAILPLLRIRQAAGKDAGRYIRPLE